VQQFYAVLRGRLGDRLRDVTLCRQRLRHLLEELGEGAWEAGGEEDPLAAHSDASRPGALDGRVLGIDPRVGHHAGGAAGRREGPGRRPGTS